MIPYVILCRAILGSYFSPSYYMNHKMCTSAKFVNDFTRAKILYSTKCGKVVCLLRAQFV